MPAKRVCSRPGCPNLTDRSGTCTACTTAADREARPSSTQRGYGHRHRTHFRPAVLARDPQCTWPAGCTEPSTIADHWPHSRRELVAAGLDPDDPARGRGLCAPHHNLSTSQAQPGGWNNR